MNLNNIKQNKLGRFIFKYKIVLLIALVFSLYVSLFPTDYTDMVEAKAIEIKNLEDGLISKKNDFEKQTTTKNDNIANLQKDIDKSNTDIQTFSAQEDDLQSQLDDKIAKEEEAKKKEKEELDKQAKIEAETKKKAEEQAKIEAEAKKYETGITWEDMARDTNGRIGEYVKLSGKIIQVMNGQGYTQYRMAVNDDYSKIVLIEITTDKLTNNILEDDYIAIEGISVGNISYNTVLGAEMTIPAVAVDNFYY